MPTYLVNKVKRDGTYHEVHESYCAHRPDPQNQHPLSSHATCRGALQKAERDGYTPADGCYYCCRPCHVG